MIPQKGSEVETGPLSDTSNVSVRPIAPGHIDSFHRALDSVARERKYLTMLEATPLPETRDFVMGMIEKGNPQFVAMVGVEVVGWCDIRRHFFPSHAHRGSLGMGIIPAYRGRGLGRRLIEAALTAVRESDIVRVELDVYEDNTRAIALYEKVGFIREGIVRRAACIDGQFIDAISMALLFDESGRVLTAHREA
jgi:RimJ/RimL family protein N-acetyltransferase